MPVKRLSEVLLLKFIMCNKNMQNLTEFADILSQWRTQALPFIMDAVLLSDINSHLLRICTNFLNVFGRLVDIGAYSWFPLSSMLFAMLQHKDLSVRRAGINLIARSLNFLTNSSRRLWRYASLTRIARLEDMRFRRWKT